VIPLTDRNPTRRFPILCVILIALNVAVFLYDQFTPVVVEFVGHTRYGIPFRAQQSIGSLSLHYAMVPAYVTGMRGEGSMALAPPPTLPPWLTLFTAMFLHANWLHIGGNMLYLWIFGNNIEDVLGRGRFLLFYFLSGLGAALLHILSDPGSMTPTVGASGAIAGLMGAYLLLYPGTRILSLVPIFGIISTLIEVPAVLVIGYWFVLQILNSQLLGGGEMLRRGGGVAYLAHVGGFVTGMGLILLFGGRRLLSPPEPPEFNEGTTRRRWPPEEE
jgi:membrane associated rhomboid family serine protease